MEPSEARRRLLAQHDDLRSLINAALRLRDAMNAGVPVADELFAKLGELRGAFAEHNALECQWLEPMLASGDAWSGARIARMLEEHGAEHHAFSAFFGGSVVQMADGLADFAEDVEAHMAAEERTFLHRNVLRDDLVVDGATA